MDVWRECYDKVKQIGQLLKDSSCDIDGEHPLPRLSIQEKRKLHNTIARLLKESNFHLGKNNFVPYQPKWQYRLNDETTHASSPFFQHKHLMTTDEIINYGPEFMCTIYRYKN